MVALFLAWLQGTPPCSKLTSTYIDIGDTLQRLDLLILAVKHLRCQVAYIQAIVNERENFSALLALEKQKRSALEQENEYLRGLALNILTGSMRSLTFNDECMFATSRSQLGAAAVDDGHC